MLCFLLKYWVGQINSIMEFNNKNLKKLYKKKKTNKSSIDKNEKKLKMLLIIFKQIY